MNGMPTALDLRAVTAVGADLDLTLIDSRAATAVALERVNAELGLTLDVPGIVATLGIPMPEELARRLPADLVEPAVQLFRSSFLSDGVAHLTPLPGAARLASALTTSGRRFVVITSRFAAPAQVCLDACGIAVSAVVGGVAGLNKAPSMVEHGVGAYVGDHPLDMQGARAAGVPAIGVTTGFHDAPALYAAGADHVVASLDEITAALG
jgi:phosphoglycolate phosphatase